MPLKHKTPARTPQMRARFEDVAYMAKTGASLEEAARRLGMGEVTLVKSMERHQAWPLLNRLRDNEREMFGETLGERRNRAEVEKRSQGNRWRTAA